MVSSNIDRFRKERNLFLYFCTTSEGATRCGSYLQSSRGPSKSHNKKVTIVNSSQHDNNISYYSYYFKVKSSP